MTAAVDWLEARLGALLRSGASNGASPAVRGRVFNAQVELLYRLAPPSLAFSMVAAALVCWLLSDSISKVRLLAWFSAMASVNLVRVMTVREYRRAPDAAAQADSWARAFWVGSLANGTLWGVCGMVLMPVAQPEMQFALVGILGVIPGIAFSSLAAIRGVFLAFALPFALSVAISLFSRGGVSETVIGVADLVFIVVLWTISKRGERDVVESHAQRFENDDLMQRLREAHASTELASRELEAEVAEHRRTEAQLREAKEAAEQANHAKSLFLANMSHEIRTPMNGVIGMTELLLQTELSERQRHYVTTAERSGRALLSIINDVLDFSKVEAGKVELEEVPFSLAAVVGDVRGLFQETAATKGIALHCAIDAAAPDHLLGDPTRLRQVLVNLVGNAIKFTREGEVALWVQACAAGDSGRALLRFEVVDTGIGLGENAKQTLFQPFTQADSDTTRKFGGTGLGLAITRHLVTLMGGTVEFESRPGEGSCFHFEISFALDSGDRGHATQRESAMGSEIRRGCAVLLVEDNAVNRLVAEGMLEQLGCVVRVAETGVQAVEFLAQASVDLVLMDCQMPVMDGLEATRRVRAMERGHGDSTRRVPIVALTANAIKGDREECLAAGMDDYLAKPFSQAALRNVLAQWLPPLPSA